MRFHKIIFLFLFFIAPFLSLAQSGDWVWLKGVDSANSLGNYGVIGVTSSTNEPPARYQSAYWKDLNGNFWVFGGVDGFNDLWKYNPMINEWTWIKGPQLKTNLIGVYGVQGVPSILNNPPALGYGSNCWTDEGGDLWLFAGSNLSGGVDDDVLWRYHIATNEWTWIKGGDAGSTLKPSYGPKGVYGSLYKPGFRTECKSAWVYDHKLWLFGGQDFDGRYRNDLWSYDIGSNNWAWEAGSQKADDLGKYGLKGIADPNNVPPSRMSYTRWQDADNNFYIFAGGALYYYNDLWKYDTKTKLWTWISGTDTVNKYDTKSDYCIPNKINSPASRYENQTAQTNGTCTKAFWTFGGIGKKGVDYVFYNDLWLCNTETLEWTKVKGDVGNPTTYNFGVKGLVASSNLLPGRGGSCVWTDNSGALYVFGGYGYLNTAVSWPLLNDLWKFIPDTSCFHTGLVGGVKLTHPNDTSICWGDSLKISIPKNCSIKIQPSSGYYIDTIKGIVSFFSNIGTRYTLIASSLDLNDPCFQNDTLSFTLSTYLLPKADFIISPPTADIANPTFNCVNQSTNAVRYEWYYNGQFISSAWDLVKTFPTRGKYCLTLVAINHCGQRDSVTKCCEVTERQHIAIPSAFTPNGDGQNDRFKALVSGAYLSYSILIVNRYGQELFSADNPNISWDGTVNNQEEEVGVYYYLIKVKFDYPNAVEEIYKGDISLLR